MKNLFVSIVILLVAFTATAQDAVQLHQTAREFMRQGDYANAILVLNRAVKLDEKNMKLQKTSASIIILPKSIIKRWKFTNLF